MRHKGRIRSSSEDGFTMVVVIFLLALFALAMAVAAPEMAKQIQLDREHETMERGKQYVRAIQLYYRKFHAYPPSIDALVDTNNIRFLRQKYKDPLTGKNDWRLIHFGQAKTQTLGFFGKPLLGAGTAGGSVLAGVGPSGGNTPANGMGGGAGLGGGSGIGGGSAFGGGSGIGGGMGSSFGGGTGSAFGGSGSSFGGTGSSFGGGGSMFGSSDSGNTGTTQGGTNGTTGAAGTAGSSGINNGSGTGLGGGMGAGLGGGDQSFGGAGIIGVAPPAENSKQSLMIFKKKDHYKDWEFVYDPLTDIKTMGGGLMGQQPGGMQGQGTQGGFGSGSGSGTG
ncbi:MAG TPA: hypothetical protein VJ732_17105, partial [Bryobacteraceae bacterium]|nr:hypothetical protein [Bryobacteraceae bacterium]